MTMIKFKNDIEKYRASLLENEQKMQGEFDKAVMALSGGALGLSFTFLREVLKTDPMKSAGWLLSAWICWGISISCVLFSFLSSAKAMRKAVKQTDAGLLYFEEVGGKYDRFTNILNHLGGALFLVGIVCLVRFIERNML